MDNANEHCLSGTVVWAATTDCTKADTATSIDAIQRRAVIFPNIGSAMLLGGCQWTACGDSGVGKVISVANDTGEKEDFLGDSEQLFGIVVSVAAGAIAGIFTFLATGDDVFAAGLAAVDAYLIADLGLSTGADALTQSCHGDLR